MEGSMLYTILIVVGILLAAILGFAATKPGAFRVERAKSIQAAPERIFDLINDFHRWDSWSPWEKLDPTMKKTFSGAVSGKGAVYEWAGNSKAGQGRMEITDTSPSSKVTIKLDFIKPFEGHNIAEFTLDAQGGSTNVTWAMFGPQAYMAKVMSVFVSMDSMIGKDFEAGLNNMKAIAEK
jgi:uncharacterized protein YndB with AHSA1/START domain